MASTRRPEDHRDPIPNSQEARDVPDQPITEADIVGVCKVTSELPDLERGTYPLMIGKQVSL